MSLSRFNLALIIALGVMSCTGEPDRRPAGSVAAEYLTIDLAHLPNYAAPTLPAHYRHTAVEALDNSGDSPVTDAGATLGRVLFFDKHLSINDSVSCASCHIQQLGFGDTAQLSLGHDRKTRTAVHSMRLANARYYNGPGFFWDRRAPTLEAQAIEVLGNSIEMGFDASRGGIDSLLSKLRGLPWYPELFALAFGDSGITGERLQRAIAQFVRSIVSADSKWDRGYAKVYDPGLPDLGLSKDLPNFTAEENRGRRIFMRGRAQGGAGCASCHVPPTFSLSAGAMSNGMDLGETRIFKAPSLKNMAVAPPYTHQGRLISPFQVAAYYNRFVLPGPALDPRLQGPKGIQLDLKLSLEDQEALAAFLRTLTDSTLLADRRFANPFKR